MQQHTSYSIKHTAYSIYHTVYNIQRTAYSVQHPAYNMQHTAFSVRVIRIQRTSDTSVDITLRDSYVLQIRSFRSEDHPYRYKKTYEKVHNISSLHRCFRCDALLECARPGGFRVANWDPPQCPRALAWRVCWGVQTALHFAFTSLTASSSQVNK